MYHSTAEEKKKCFSLDSSRLRTQKPHSPCNSLRLMVYLFCSPVWLKRPEGQGARLLADDHSPRPAQGSFSASCIWVLLSAPRPVLIHIYKPPPAAPEEAFPVYSAFASFGAISQIDCTILLCECNIGAAKKRKFCEKKCRLRTVIDGAAAGCV